MGYFRRASSNCKHIFLSHPSKEAHRNGGTAFNSVPNRQAMSFASHAQCPHPLRAVSMNVR